MNNLITRSLKRGATAVGGLKPRYHEKLGKISAWFLAFSLVITPILPIGSISVANANGLTVDSFAVFGAGDSANGNTTQIGKNVQVSGGMVGSNRSVHLAAGSSAPGVRAGADATLGGETSVDDSSGNGGSTNTSVIANREAKILADGVVVGDIDADEVYLGDTASVTGNVVSGSDITMTNASTVTGDVDAQDTDIRRNTTIGGTLTLPVGVNPSGTGINDNSANIGTTVNGAPKSPQTFTKITLPTPNVYTPSSDSSDDVDVANGATETITPGTYRDLDFAMNSTVTLSSGHYVVRKITGSQGLILNLDLSGGPIVVFAGGDIKFGQDTLMVLNGGNATTLYWETSGTFKTNSGSTIFGTVHSTKSNSPNADGIAIGKDNTVTGALYSGQQVSVSSGSTVTLAGPYWGTPVPTTGSLKVTKTTVNGDGTFEFTSNAGDFSITTTENSGSETISELDPGTYSVTEENLPDGWTETNNTCVDVEVVAGETAECSITNTFENSSTCDFSDGQNVEWNITGPDPISIGTGLSADHMAVATNCEVSVALKAHERYVGDIVPTDNNRYRILSGESPTSGTNSDPAEGLARWNYTFAVNLGSLTFNDVDVVLDVDFDPAIGESDLVSFNYSLYKQLLLNNSDESTHQASENLGFDYWSLPPLNAPPFDPFANGEYELTMRVTDGDSEIISLPIVIEVYTPGCTDSTAVNYDENASENDGTCTYSESKIILPAVDNEEFTQGNINLSAFYFDQVSNTSDNVQWAVRFETCAASTGTVMGNVDGKDDGYEWDGINFNAVFDASTATPGNYCFVFNPKEDPGSENVRLTREFTVLPPTAEPISSEVTLCKLDDSQNPLQGWTLMLRGEEIETLSVPSENSVGADSSSLSSGVWHIFKAFGTWLNDRSAGENYVDAEYSTTDEWDTYMDGFTGYGENILDLQVDENFVDWGSYNDTHEYAMSYLPSVDGSVNFRIFDGQNDEPIDSWYSDNSGSLSVSLSTGYVGVTGQDGCVTFTEVPFGNWFVDELLQTGWENISGLGEVTVENGIHEFYVVNKLADTNNGGGNNGGGDEPVIEAYKWSDADFDGERGEEEWLENWRIALARIIETEESEGVPVEIVAMSLTDANGLAQFSIPDEGDYVLLEEIKDGWLNTAPAERETPLSVSCDEALVELATCEETEWHVDSFFDIEIPAVVTEDITVDNDENSLWFGNYQTLVISEETASEIETESVTITWLTDKPGTSRVVYDTVSHDPLGSAPNYGYAFSTTEDPTKVTDHSVLITGLTPGQTYYYRVISSASPEVTSEEHNFSTSSDENNENGSSGGTSTGGGGGGGGIIPVNTTSDNNDGSGGNDGAGGQGSGDTNPPGRIAGVTDEENDSGDGGSNEESQFGIGGPSLIAGGNEGGQVLGETDTSDQGGENTESGDTENGSDESVDESSVEIPTVPGEITDTDDDCYRFLAICWYWWLLLILILLALYYYWLTTKENKN